MENNQPIPKDYNVRQNSAAPTRSNALSKYQIKKIILTQFMTYIEMQPIR